VAAGRGRSRRVSIPGVAELLRPAAPGPVASDERQATGREKHDQKITVYLSADELVDLEQARLALRRYGLVIDRGRLVREAVAILLADLDARGKDSLVARRVRATVDAGIDATVPDLPAVELNGHNELAGQNGTALKADDAGAGASPLPSLSWARVRVAR
jgi:hypothetical protein